MVELLILDVLLVAGLAALPRREAESYAEVRHTAMKAAGMARPRGR